jgi:spore coat protein CotF
MNDQIIMENYLLVLKSTVEVYVHGTLEASNKEVRSILKDNLNNIMTSQADTYDLMTKYGWYTINNVETTKIQETLNKLNSKN